MSWSSRRASVVLAILAVLGILTCWQQVSAQRIIRKPPIAVDPTTEQPPSQPTDPNGLTSGIDLVVKDRLEQQIVAAQDYIQDENWATAVDILQQLLDIKEDVFASVTRKGADGKVGKSIVSVRAEANRMVANLPPKGLEFYKKTHGPTAASLLKQAKELNNDPATLAQVTTRFLYTDAGADAVNLLATFHLDRGNYTNAALCYEKLMQREGASKLPPNILFKAALSFHRVGDKANEETAWKNLATKAQSVKLGRITKSVDDLKTYVASLKSENVEFGLYDWPMFGGKASRTGQGGEGGTAFLEPKWVESTIRENATKTHLDQAFNWLERSKQPVLSASFPIAATINREGKALPLVIYRSFWGIHARNVLTGELEWEAPSNWSIDRIEKEGKYAGNLHQWLQIYLNNGSKPEILFENSMVGTLTTDNTRVYCIEDLAVPPFSTQSPYNPQPVTYNGKLGEAINHNRLQAYDLDSGKLIWEAGEYGNKDNELSDTYFLGAPLPLNGKLFVLTEKNQSLRLVTLDPTTGKLVGSPQRLADTRDKMVQDLARRINASQLAYGEGILVCPTNAGAVLGVDLLSGSLVWAYAYREGGRSTQAWDPNKGIPPGMIIGPDGRYIPAVPNINNWKTSAPCITEGKVVFTAPDASSVHCVNLRDGTRVWKHSKQDDDLYLAGVFAGKVVIVGKKSCRGLNLADGSEAWRVDTGMPSGQGIASNNIYYLPLVNAIATKEPEICVIDVVKGTALAHTRSRKKEIPGNLIFYEGTVLSQNVTQVAAYPQLNVELKRIDELLSKKSTDPEGLIRRGDLRLDKGDLKGAIEDLRTALGNKPPQDMVAKARLKLYESFTEYFQRDFNAAEQYIKEYEAMCSVPGDAAEEKRRKGNYYCLLGKGREEQKKLVDAFEAYMNFGTLGADQELLSVVDQPAVKASPSVWAQGRIASMVARATREERAPLEALIAKRWKEVKDSDLSSLRNFVNTFGSMFNVGKEARLQLAERLIEDNDPKSLLEAEQHLGVLREQPDDSQTSARAVEALARLMTRKNLMEDAAYYYRVLGRDYPKVVVKDGRTGLEYYNDLATDKRFLPYLDEPTRFGMGKMKAEEQRGNFPYQTRLYTFEGDGEDLPFFQRFQLKFSTDYHQLKVFDTTTNKEYWSEGLEQTHFATLLNNYRNPQQQPRFPYQNLGHLVVLQLGHMVFALDPVNKQVLWKKNLSGQSSIPGYRSHSYDPRDGSLQIVYQHGWTQRLGQAGPLSPTAVVLQTSDALVGVDPVSGKTLWSRSDMPKSAHIFNDSEYIYVVEVNDGGNAGGTRALRMHDGYEIKVKDFSAQYQKRIRTMGRSILYSETDEKGGLTLRLYDVLTGKDAWTQGFPANTIVLKSERTDLAGVIEPDGSVTVVDVNKQKQVLKAKMDPEHLAKMQSVHLLQDRKYIYIACNGPTDRVLMPWGGLMSNLMPGTGMQCLPVNGEVYCWESSTGKMRWHNSVPNQMLILDQFNDLPICLFTARYQRWAPGAVNQRMVMAVCTKSIDKRTGKLLYDKEDLTSNMQQYHALNVDARGGKIELISYMMKVTHSMASDSSSTQGTGTGPGNKSSQLPQRGPGPQVDVAVPVPQPVPLPPPIIKRRIQIER